MTLLPDGHCGRGQLPTTENYRRGTSVYRSKYQTIENMKSSKQILERKNPPSDAQRDEFFSPVLCFYVDVADYEFDINLLRSSPLLSKIVFSNWKKKNSKKWLPSRFDSFLNIFSFYRLIELKLGLLANSRFEVADSKSGYHFGRSTFLPEISHIFTSKMRFLRER